MHSPDITEQNIEKLLDLFPNCKTEKQGDNGDIEIGIDFDLLKQELSKTIVEGPKERYQLNWPGKKQALLNANAPIAKTLRPCREESVDFDTTENLFIEGDNLDALKLLQETYLGKVKMIYIDPPYNTGNDFIYADNFAESTDEYLQESGQKDEEGNRLVANTDSNGRFHSDWLSMIFSRMKLARNLLTEDGVIFISIDDSEQANLKRLCDEVFGEDNFINQISLNSKVSAGASGGGEDRKLKKNIEYILMYCKSYSDWMPINPIYKDTKLVDYILQMKKDGKSFKYTNVLYEVNNITPFKVIKDGKGNDINISSVGNYEIKTVKQVAVLDGITEEEVYAKYHDKIMTTTNAQTSIRDRVWDATDNENNMYIAEYTPSSGKNKGKPTQLYLVGRQKVLVIWLKDSSISKKGEIFKREKIGTYWDGFSWINVTKEGGVKFPNGKKPIALIEQLLKLIPNNKDMLILDFFAGSGSAAHAVMMNNLTRLYKNKFITVHLPEIVQPITKENKDYLKYLEVEGITASVSDIAKERLRRAGKKIKQENPAAKDLDIGFRVLKIDSSNMNDVHFTPDAVSKLDLLDQIEHIKPDRSAKDLLFQVMLDWGVDLSLPIRAETIEGKTVYFVNDDDLVACFDKDIDETLIKFLAAFEPLRVVFRDDGFVSDSVKINAEQIFKQLSPSTDIKVI